MNIELGILASGGLGFECLQKLQEKYLINFVFADKGSQAITELCSRKNIPCFIGNPRAGKAQNFLAQYRCSLLLSINYLFVVEQDVIEHASGYAINFHGSLLPKYRGRTPHVWAIINNEPETGITAHLITPGCDEGDIVYQERIAIEKHMTGGDVLNIFYQRYPAIIDHVIHLVQTDSVKLQKQEHAKATVFGKRTPEDGRINWQWQKERICNWVRALAKPYPGAFTYLGDAKLTIHKIEFSDTGFFGDIKNGTVVHAGDHLEIKTPNGVVRLVDYELDTSVEIVEGMLLS